MMTSISEIAYEKLKSRDSRIPELPTKKILIIGANKSKSVPVTKQIFLEIEISGLKFESTFLVVRNLLYDVILGVDFLRKYNAKIDFTQNVINLYINDINNNKEDLCSEIHKSANYEMNNVLTYQGKSQTDADPDIIKLIDSKVVNCKELNVEQKIALRKLLIEFKEVFAKSSDPIINYEFCIELYDTKPFKQKIYPIPQKYKDEVDNLISNMLADNIIEKCTSAYVNPLVIVRKKQMI